MENVSITVLPVWEVLLVTALPHNRLVLHYSFLFSQYRLLAFFASEHFLGRGLLLHLVRVNYLRFFFEIKRIFWVFKGNLLQLVSSVALLVVGVQLLGVRITHKSVCAAGALADIARWQIVDYFVRKKYLHAPSFRSAFSLPAYSPNLRGIEMV